MEEDQQAPDPAPRPRRRRTALVSRNWAASAAVIAAMTVGGVVADDTGDGDGQAVQGDTSSSTFYGDPYEAPDTYDA